MPRDPRAATAPVAHGHLTNTAPDLEAEIEQVLHDARHDLNAPQKAHSSDCGPAWPQLLAAARAAQAVLRTTDPVGLSAQALQLAGRAFAYTLASAGPRTRLLGFVLFATRGAKGDPLADRRTVENIWKTLDEVRRPQARSLRRPRSAGARRGPLPVEAAKAVPLDILLARLGFELRRVGREFVTRCPFHDDGHPSLTVNAERGLWYCFPCGIGGDGIAFVERLHSCTFADAVREVALKC